jgi:hypothetical protein
MFFTRELLANDVRTAQHWNHLWAGRRLSEAQDANIVQMAVNAGLETNDSLLTRDFWRATDAIILEMRDQETGMEIIQDLLAVQTTLDIGKTVKAYNMVGGIADDVSVSMDGQAPYSFDHTEYDTDADPIPIISAGYGVNWRYQRGLQTVGIDLARDSQTAKMKEYNKKLVSHALDGNAKIVVDGKASQGLRNHRNTKKFNLGAAGLNVNLTAATVAQLIAFFQGPFATLLTANRVAKLDILWVSPEIMSNLGKVYVENGVTVGTGLDYLLRFIRVKEVRETFALTGNEFLGYVRQRSVVSPLVGMTTSVIALPRPMPQSNYNFQIMGAMGMQVTVDGNGMGGVFYGADLD